MNRFLVFFFLLTASLCAQTQERVTLTDGTINYGRTRPMVNGGLSSFSGTNPVTLTPGSGLVVSGSTISTTGTSAQSGTSQYSVTSGSAAQSGTAGYSVTSGTAAYAAQSGTAQYLGATTSGTQDYYIVNRTDGKMGSGTLADPYDGSAIQTIHQWTPPGFSTVVTSTCLSRYDAALQSIPAGSGSNAIVIHLGAGVFQTGGIPRLSPSTGLTTGSNAYYNCPQIKDGWVIKGAPGYGTTLRLANNAAQSEPLVSGSDNEWYVIGPIYDSQPGLPDYITRFEIDDLLIDGNVQNQNWGGAGTGAVTAAGLTAQYYSTYRRVQAINCGYTGSGGEIIDFLAARTFNTTGPCYAIIDSCMVSGTVYGSDGDGIVENAGEGNPAINLISTISNCSVTTTGTQTLNIGIAVADGSNSNAYVVNNYVSGCNDGIYSDTGYFDRITVTGNRLIGDGLGITIYGLSASNLLFSNNYITTRQGGNSFFGNTNPASGTITDNTMILDGTASSAGAILNNGGGSGRWIISNNRIGVGMVINTGTAAIYGFGNKFTDGTDVTALNNAGYSSLSGTANYAAQSGTAQNGPGGAFGNKAFSNDYTQTMGDTDVVISGSTTLLLVTGSFTGSHGVFLPPITPGNKQSVRIQDSIGTVSATKYILVQPYFSGTNALNGGANTYFTVPFSAAIFTSDGTNNWSGLPPGSAAFTSSTNYATAAQGTKANSALQGITTPNVLFTSPVSVTSNTAAMAFVNTFTPNQLLYTTATNNLGFLAIGSGLSLSSGTLSASATSLTGTGGISIASGTASLVTGSNGYFPGTLRQWFTNGTRGKTIAICGDSTSESITGASAIYNELSRYQVAGGLLDGVTVTAYGRTGMTAAAAISDTNAAGFLQCVASQPNVIVISFDINDGRVGATYASMLASNIALVNYIETNSPATDIVWRLPNVFTSDDVGGNGFVTPNSSAQAYCNAIRSAGLALANIWPNLTIVDESPIFGTVCLSSSSWPLSAYMSNQLHPSQAGYQLIGDVIANLLGQKQAASTFSPNVATTLRATLYQDYWAYFPAVQDPNYYDVVFSAPVNALNTSLGIQVGINADGNYAGIKAKMLAIGYDVFQINNQPPILLQSVNFNTSSQFYLNQSAAISSIVASGTANALVTTSVTHYLTNQEPVAIISNTGSSPVVSGTYTATVTSGSTFLISVANLSGTGTAGVVRPVALPQTSPAVSGSSINQPYGTITFYRSKYGNDSTIQQYWIDEATYPYRWRGVTVSAGNSSVWTAGGVFVDSLPQELPGINRTTKVGDTLIVQGKGAFAINAIGSSSPWYGAGQKITTSSTDTSAFGGLPFAIVSGSHGYENGTSRRNTSYPYHFLQIDDAITGNMLVSGTVTASGYVGPGVGLTGTAAALTAGIANGVTGTNSGSFGFSGSNGIIGTTGTATVTPGSVGEIVSSVVSGTSVSLSGGTPANITSISLTAGDWDVSGVVSFSGTNATITGEIANSGTSSATLITDGYEAYSGALTTLATDTDSVTLSRRRYSLPTTTTVYLVGYVNFSAGTVVGFGNITARRMR